jgi:hypothetical protein
MKDPEPTDAFERTVEGLCMNLPAHVGETLKEGKQKGEIDKTHRDILSSGRCRESNRNLVC